MSGETLVSHQSPFRAIGSELVRSVEAAFPKLLSISDRTATEPRATGKWSPKQVIGHLIDSAANNHQRFVRAQQEEEFVFPGYEQNHWVNCQRYNSRSWDELTTLWRNYNHHVAHVMTHIPEDRRLILCRVGSNAPVTLGFLAHDYVVHLRHHLAQLDAV